MYGATRRGTHNGTCDRPRCAGRGERNLLDDVTEAHRLVVDDVVGAAGGRAFQRRDRGARRIVDMDARQQAAIAANRGAACGDAPSSIISSVDAVSGP